MENWSVFQKSRLSEEKRFTEKLDILVKTVDEIDLRNMSCLELNLNLNFLKYKPMTIKFGTSSPTNQLLL